MNKVSGWKQIAKDLLPPIVLNKIRPRVGLQFIGDYLSWQAAKDDCIGYDQPSILEKVSLAAEAVIDGSAEFERDSVLFDKPDYNWPLVAVLQQVAMQSNNEMRLIDFGGSLGSTYRQCRSFLKGIKLIEWNVVEQSTFIKRGREKFQTDELRFYSTVEESLAYSNSNCLLLSSVLQYLDSPYDFLEGMMNMDFKFIILDRTPLSVDGRERIVKQVVPPEIYSASYPARLFKKEKLLATFFQKYRIAAEFPSLDGFDNKAEFKGFYFVNDSVKTI